MGTPKAKVQTTKVVVVTGASRGFGEAATEELAGRGHIVVATMRSPERDGERIRSLDPGAIEVAQLDVTDGAQVTSVIGSVVARHGRIDALVNNAGYGLYGTVEDVSEGELHQQFNTNFFGQWRLCQAVVPHMRSAGSGTILNMASAGIFLVAPLTGLYSASKAAVAAMSEALALEVEAFGIRVTTLVPGMYRSDWQGSSLAICDRLTEGNSVYQERSNRALEAFRELAATRPGSRTVGSVIADLVEIEQPLPRQYVIGDDALRLASERANLTEAGWSALAKNGPFFDAPTTSVTGAKFPGY